jgi:hypothetical protein
MPAVTARNKPQKHLLPVRRKENRGNQRKEKKKRENLGLTKVNNKKRAAVDDSIQSTRSL